MRIDGEVVDPATLDVPAGELAGKVLQVGKRRFVRVAREAGQPSRAVSAWSGACYPLASALPAGPARAAAAGLYLLVAPETASARGSPLRAGKRSLKTEQRAIGIMSRS